MPERTYSGFARRGETTLPDRVLRFERGVPVEVTAEEAEILDENPEWGGTPKHDDLEGLKKPALVEIADAEGVDVNKRWGVQRLADEIREHRLALTAEVDDPEEADNG